MECYLEEAKSFDLEPLQLGAGPLDLVVQTLETDSFGLTTRELRTLSRVMKGKILLAADICEFAPALDSLGRATDCNVAALIFKNMCMLADAKTRCNGEYRQTKWELNLSTSSSFPSGPIMDRWKKEKANGTI